MAPESIRILIVDDSRSIVESLGRILEVTGYRVDVSYNGGDALRKLSSNNYDLVVSDIEMPGLNGLEFLSKVRIEYGESIPVILMTGFLEQEYFIKAIRLGASDFIRKPIDAKQIIRSIQTLVNKTKEHNEYNEFYKYLENTEHTFIINPANYSKANFTKVLSSYLQHSFQIDKSILNETTICLEEMIYNAFIHGTLGLEHSERLVDHKSYIKLIQEKLSSPGIAEKRILLKLSINQIANKLIVTIEDQGDGFDYQYWIDRVHQDNTVNLDGHGRGIGLIYHLSDKLEFLNGGRTVRIEKNLSNAKIDSKAGK